MTASIRFYGKAPYSLVLVHGGPGARGSLAGVGAELGKTRGVLEALQTRNSINELLIELHEQLQAAHWPLTLAGHSWGAWLALLYAAQFPQQVTHLVCISCPPLTPHFADQILQRRLERLSPSDAQLFQQALEVLEKGLTVDRDDALQTLDRLTQQTDYFEPCEYDDHALKLDVSQYQAVWAEALRLRQEGKLTKAARKIQCPVSLLHGKQDPHPLAGAAEPMRACGLRPQILLFDKCSHSPFAEKYARQAFYKFLQTA